MSKLRRGLQTRRLDILRNDELDDMFKKLEGKDKITVVYKTKVEEKEVIEKHEVNCKMVRCLLALLWLFGKRKIEVLTLKKRDIAVTDADLVVRFKVRKKREEYRGGVKVSYAKRITRENPYTKHVLDWLQEIDNPGDYLFPGRSRKRIRVVTRRWRRKDGTEVKKSYRYRDLEEGHLSREMAWKIVKFLNPKAWIHLFRRSVATQMAEEGASEEELMRWFDWDSPLTAHRYVEAGTRLAERWTKRKW